MRNKSLLVAQREYMENLRTKTFWIGIFFMPVIIVLAIAVPIWLERTKDARKYAVIDHTDWLAQAVEERATLPDVKKVLRMAIENTVHQEESAADLPKVLREFAAGAAAFLEAQAGEDTPEATLAVLDEDLGRKFMEASAELISGLSDPENKAFDLSKLPGGDQALKEIIVLREALRDWWRSLPPEEAKQYGEQLNKSRYVRVDVDTSGSDVSDVRDRLNKLVAEEKLFAYFEIGPDPLAGNEGFRYVSNNLTDDELREWFERHATEEVRERRLAEENIPEEVAEHIQAPIRFDKKKLSETGEEEEVATEDTLRQWAPVVLVYILWIAIFSITQMLLTNTIEEKSNRILEVLLSSVSPLQLMTGKIAGIALTGLTMVVSWVISFLLLVNFVPKLMNEKMPFDLNVIARDPGLLTSFIVYFLLGYLFFAALLVGIGSVCNSIKEANNLMMPVTVVLMLPLLSMIPIAKDPNGELAVFLSYVPPFTPFVMMNRAAGPPTTTEYVVTTILLLVSISVVFWAAAKVFRIGILMTGKPPTPMEILRWIRAPVGLVPTRKEP